MGYFLCIISVAIMKYRLSNLVCGALVRSRFVNMNRPDASVKLGLVLSTAKIDLSIVALELCYDLCHEDLTKFYFGCRLITTTLIFLFGV